MRAPTKTAGVVWLWLTATWGTPAGMYRKSPVLGNRAVFKLVAGAQLGLVTAHHIEGRLMMFVHMGPSSFHLECSERNCWRCLPDPGPQESITRV